MFSQSRSKSLVNSDFFTLFGLETWKKTINICWNKLMREKVDTWQKRGTNEQTDKWMNEWTNERPRTDEQTDKWMNEWTNERPRTDEQTNERTNKRMNKCTNERTFFSFRISVHSSVPNVFKACLFVVDQIRANETDEHITFFVSFITEPLSNFPVQKKSLLLKKNLKSFLAFGEIRGGQFAGFPLIKPSKNDLWSLAQVENVRRSTKKIILWQKRQHKNEEKKIVLLGEKNFLNLGVMILKKDWAIGIFLFFLVGYKVVETNLVYIMIALLQIQKEC